MKIYTYTLTPLRLSGTELLTEASAEELRVLVCLMESGGEAELSALAKGAGVREARAASAVSFWEAAGVIRLGEPAPRAEGSATAIVDEFSYRLQADTIEEESAVCVADAIRDHSLSGMLTECATLLGRPTLNDREIRALTGLYTQYALSEEYIVTLLADMCTRSRCTVRTLVNRAIKLSEKGVDTIEKLNDYFHRRDEHGEWERRMRRVLGVYDRALTTEEKTLFRKWVELYGFGDDILSLAFNQTVHNTARYSASYMDKMLTDWYENDCHTREACEARYAASRPKDAQATSSRKTAAPKERYGSFDPEEAFRRALERSYKKSQESSDSDKS